MRKVVSVSIIMMLALLLVDATPSLGQRRRPSPRARPRGRVLVNVGPFWGPSPHFVYAPPPVIVQPSPIFVQQHPQVIYVQQPPVIVQQPPVIAQQPTSPAPPQGSSAAPSHEYWYFCPSARAYYPTVQDCPEEWIRVPPRPA